MDALAAPGIRIDADRLTALRALAATHGLRKPMQTAMTPGGLPSKRRGRGTDIEDVRPWSFGDDIRHIDRNATARTGIAHVRRFHDENETVTLLILDLRPSMLFGTRRAFRSVAAAEALALAGWRAAARGARLGLFVIGGAETIHVPPRAGSKSMPEIAQVMARCNDRALAQAIAADRPLDGLLSALLDRLPRNGEAILASSLEAPGANFTDTLSLMRRKLRLTIIGVEDAFSRDRPSGLYPFLTLAGRKGVASARSAQTSGPIGSWAKLCRELAVSFVALDTRLAPEEMLRTLEAAE